MADLNKIKEILRRDVSRGKLITEQQLTEVAERISKLPTIDENTLRRISESVAKDPDIFIVGAIDMGDIKDELGKHKK